MGITGLAGLSVFVALTFRSLVTLGESVITSEGDKRSNNFQVPGSMPYDPNFWPSRGRRGRHPDRVIRDICDAIDRDFLLEQRALRCPAPGLPEGEPDKWKWPPAEAEAKTEEEDEGGFPVPPTEPPRKKPGERLPDDLDADVPLNSRRSEQLRNKKQKQFALPRLILYWDHENPYAEKKKKQDVFWVARGKKNLYRHP